MTLLASVLIPSLVLAVAGLEVGCSSDDNSNTTPLTPFDSGTTVVPEASAGAGPVTISIGGGNNVGYVVSDDGVLRDGGPNGFGGIDGGSPVVDCPGACTAAQGTLLYTYPAANYTFLGWSVKGAATTDAGPVYYTTATNLRVDSDTPAALVANFAPIGG